MDDWDNESNELWILKKSWIELLVLSIVLVIFIGYLVYSDHPMSWSWFRLLTGTAAISLGLLGLLQKRISFKGLIYKGEKARTLSILYIICGLVFCFISLLILKD